MPKDDALQQFETWSKDIDSTKLGGLIKEYVLESNHSSWEGYSRRDLTSIRNLFKDIMTYHKAKGVYS